MYTEIIKIIEGGLKKEPNKVLLYAKKLAEKLKSDGNDQLAKGINNLLANRAVSTVTMEQLITTAPVDDDSKMSIVDVFNPVETDLHLVLPESIEKKINDFVKIIKNQEKIKSLGLNSQNTLLLYGAPGVGKSTIAKYISLKTGLPLVTARMDSLISSLLGNTSKNIRKIFEYADSKPCILFLDEFDAIAKARDDQHENGELKRVINSLLQNIDLFTQNNILIAATNHPQLLDRAIWRRFNNVMEVGQPNAEGINRLMELYLGNFRDNASDERKKYDRVVQLFAKKSPSDIRTVINNSITKAVIEGRMNVLPEDLLIENFEFDSHGKYNSEDLIKYLNDNGVSRQQISDLLNLSVRQIRNNLKENPA